MLGKKNILTNNKKKILINLKIISLSYQNKLIKINYILICLLFALKIKNKKYKYI